MENQNSAEKKEERKKDIYRTDISENLLCTCSATDCTGLIPAGITDDDLESYEQLYPYLPIQSAKISGKDQRDKETT